MHAGRLAGRGSPGHGLMRPRLVHLPESIKPVSTCWAQSRFLQSLQWKKGTFAETCFNQQVPSHVCLLIFLLQEGRVGVLRCNTGWLQTSQGVCQHRGGLMRGLPAEVPGGHAGS